MTDALHIHKHKNKDTVLKFDDVSITYGKQEIVNNISFEIAKNTFVAIMGVNGSGKTTLIKSILNLVKYQGNIILDGKNINDFKKKELAKLIAYVPQLFTNKENVTVYDYISFGRFPYSGGLYLKKNDKKIINNIITTLKLDKIKNKFLHEISGGQRQKVAIASALVQETEIIILDEPTTYLDLKNQYEILEIMHLLHLTGKTVIVVLHDINQAIKYVDSVVLLHNHKIHSIGDPHKVFTNKNINEVYGVSVITKKIGQHNHIIDVDSKIIMEEIKWF